MHGYLATRACAVTERHLNHMPPCVISAVIKTWCNGWVPTRRFKEQDTGCVFDCDSAEHSLEHYAVFPKCVDCWTRITKIPNLSGSLGFFALSDEHQSIQQLRCAHMYAIYSVVMHQNAMKTKLTDTNSMFKAVRERWMFILGKSRSLRSHRAYVLQHARNIEDGIQ